MLHIIPFALLVLVQCHRLPIDSKDRTLFCTAERWHLEREEVQVVGTLTLHVHWLAIVIALDDEAVGQELTVKASDNEDLRVAELCHAGTLPRGQTTQNRLRIRSHVQEFPVLRLTAFELESLDRVAVLFVRVLDATKHVDELVAQVAARVVVATFLHLRQLHPLVDLRIVALNTLRSSIDLLARARHNDVSVHDLADRVAMAGILHPFFIKELQVVLCRVALRDDLAALEHAIGQSLEVATSDHEYTWDAGDADLDHLKVVREVAAELDELVLDLLGHRIVRSDCLRVFLENTERLGKRDFSHRLLLVKNASIDLSHDRHAALVRRRLLHCEFSFHVNLCREHAALCGEIFCIVTLSHVFLDLVVHDGFLTARANHLDALHKVLDLPVYSGHARVLTALGTAHHRLIACALLAE